VHTCEKIPTVAQAAPIRKQRMRTELPRIYSQELLNNLFRHPYNKIEFVMDDLLVTRLTAARYLNELVRIGLLSKHRLGRENFYLNDGLFVLLSNVGTEQEPEV
jgi:Fic family protein